MKLLFLFIIGLCVGSFLNVVIDRIPNGKSILLGRSQCDFCKKTLEWFDLIPVFSYISLQGKCRYCHKNLSVQYPLIEITTGCLFITLFLLETPNSLRSFEFFLIDLLILCICIALFIMDTKYHLLSDRLLVCFVVLVGLRLFLTAPNELIFHLFVGFVALIPLFLLFLLSQGKAMGFGDVKLIFIIGFLLGFPMILIDYYVAFLLGALIGLLLIILQKKKFIGSTIAFGPFLLIAMAISLLWGNVLWRYIVQLLGL